MAHIESTSYQCEMCPNNAGIRFIMPGFTYDDVDRYDTIPLEKMARMEEETRYVVHNPATRCHPNPDISAYSKLVNSLTCNDHMIFLASFTFEITPALNKLGHMYKNLIATDQIANIKNSSFMLLSTCHARESNELLYRVIKQGVLVSRKTRRPTQVPTDTKLRLKPYESFLQLDRIEKLPVPEGTHCAQDTMRWSDMDANNHANNTAYLRICTDAMSEAAAAGQLSSVINELGFYWISKVQALCLNESLPGQPLEVRTWQGSQPLLIHSVIQRNKEQIFQCTIQFRQPVSSKL